MIAKLFTDIQLLWYFYKGSKTIYDIHSPFFFDFLTNVCDISKDYYAYQDIETLRNNLLNINKLVEYTDLGAGSKVTKKGKRKIKDIARHSSTSKRDGKWLHNCVIHYNSKLILELGTSLGIGTSYLASANKRSKVITLEGDPASAYIARRNFELLGLTNIQVIEGKFDTSLPKVLKRNKPFDLVFIDGHHSGEATLRYFKLIAPRMSENSIIIMDDIYWSWGMQDAWKAIIQDPHVSSSIDLYSKGFLFINHTQLKSILHHKIIRTRYKPWRIGIGQ